MPTPTCLAFDLGASSCRPILGRLEGERMTMEEVHRFTTLILEENGHLYRAIRHGRPCRGYGSRKPAGSGQDTGSPAQWQDHT